jgi:hypothetical protein
VRYRLAVGILLTSVACAFAQTRDDQRPIRLAQSSQAPISQPTITSPTSPSSPQSQAFTSCVMNCDTRAGTCQGTCSVGNSAATAPSLFGPTFSPRTDIGALPQCYLNCTTQQLACKQACNIH